MIDLIPKARLQEFSPRQNHRNQDPNSQEGKGSNSKTFHLTLVHLNQSNRRTQSPNYGKLS